MRTRLTREFLRPMENKGNRSDRTNHILNPSCNSTTFTISKWNDNTCNASHHVTENYPVGECVPSEYGSGYYMFYCGTPPTATTGFYVDQYTYNSTCNSTTHLETNIAVTPTCQVGSTGQYSSMEFCSSATTFVHTTWDYSSTCSGVYSQSHTQQIGCDGSVKNQIRCAGGFPVCFRKSIIYDPTTCGGIGNGTCVSEDKCICKEGISGDQCERLGNSSTRNSGFSAIILVIIAALLCSL